MTAVLGTKVHGVAVTTGTHEVGTEVGIIPIPESGGRGTALEIGPVTKAKAATVEMTGPPLGDVQSSVGSALGLATLRTTAPARPTLTKRDGLAVVPQTRTGARRDRPRPRGVHDKP